jgi:hypothetical protein
VRRWGIYLTDEGIWRLADRLRQSDALPELKAHDLLRTSTNLLLLHEFFHFLTDVAAVGLEFAEPASPKSLYVAHAEAVHAAAPQKGRPREEALANAFADRRLRPTALRPAARQVFTEQPDGYRDFGRYLSPAGFQDGCRGLAAELAIGSARNVAGSPPHELLFDSELRQYSFGDVPVWFVQRLRATPYELAFIESINPSALHETDAFQKDVAKLPRQLKTKLEKALPQLVDTRHRGLQFKPLTNCGQVWSIRVGKDQGGGPAPRG